MSPDARAVLELFDDLFGALLFLLLLRRLLFRESGLCELGLEIGVGGLLALLLLLQHRRVELPIGSVIAIALALGFLRLLLFGQALEKVRDLIDILIWGCWSDVSPPVPMIAIPCYGRGDVVLAVCFSAVFLSSAGFVSVIWPFASMTVAPSLNATDFLCFWASIGAVSYRTVSASAT